MAQPGSLIRSQTVWHISKRGNSYSVRYTYENEHGKSCDKWESFPTKEEATNRKKQIEHELAAGTFLILSSVTAAEFLMDWLPKECSKHKWALKTYESNLSTIQNLIIPYIGSMEMQKLKPYHMDNLYTTLSKTPCGSYIEGRKQELTEKQKQRFLSGTTSLILKSTKTASSCRTIFMTSALKEELKNWLNQLAADERKDPTRYHDSGMLFRLPNGLAVEPVLIRKKFLKWQDAHPEFPHIVFHGLRHSSATYQLMISGGDVKAVQGTTGHATADMLVNTYAHIQQSSRVELGRKFEEGFYAKQESPSPQVVPTEGEPTISMTALLELLKNADPRSKGAAPSGTADLMQNLPRISKQFQPMQRIPTKKPTVQKPCIDRADPDFSGLHNEKER